MTGALYSKQMVIGMAIIALFVVAGVLAHRVAPYSPGMQRLSEDLQPPSFAHPCGQDKLGRDVLSRVLVGARVSLLVSVIAVSISAAIGVALGGLAGYVGGRTDELILRGIDVLLAFPGTLLAIALSAVLGPSLRNVIVALCAIGWSGYARLVRAEVLVWRTQEFVSAAVALGGGPLRVLVRHILPQLIAPVLVQVSFGMAAAIMAEAGLSFLGLGVQPPTPSWGSMINEGRAFLLIAPHVALFPGLAISLTVLGWQCLAEGLREVMDVRSGGKELA